MSVEQTSPRRPEEQRFWLERLEELGCTSEQATVLCGLADVDLHQVAETLLAGCDPNTCFDIFS